MAKYDKNSLQAIINDPNATKEDKELATEILNDMVKIDIAPIGPKANVAARAVATQAPQVTQVQQDTQAPQVTQVQQNTQDPQDTQGGTTLIPGTIQQIENPVNLHKTTTTSSGISKEDFNDAYQSGESQKQLIKDKAQESDAIFDKLNNDYKTWASNTAIVNQSLANVAPKIVDKLIKVNESLFNSIEELKKTEIDPYRYQRNMSTTEKVLTTLAQGLLIGIRQPDVVGKAIDAAINRDIAIQQFNYNTKLKSLDLSEAQAAQLTKLYERNLEQQRINTLEISKVRIAQAANESKRIDVQLSAANQISKIDDRINKLRSGMAGKVVETSEQGYRTQSFKFGDKVVTNKQNQPDPVYQRQVRNDVAQLNAGIAAVERAEEILKRAKLVRVAGKELPTSDGIELNRVLNEVSLTNRTRLGDKGPIRGDQDIKTFDPVRPQTFWSQVLDVNSNLLERLGKQKQLLKDEISRKVKAGGQTYSEFKQEQGVSPSVESTESEIMRRFRSNPRLD